MNERIADPTRHFGDQPPPPRTLSQPEMTYAEAREFYAGMTWRTIYTRSHRAMEAVIKEVDRLHAERDSTIAAAVAAMGSEPGSQCSRLARMRTPCWRLRSVFSRIGLIPEPEPAQPECGA